MAGDLRTVNLEDGHPPVDASLRRLSFELRHSRNTGVAVLKLIHGYGSSGPGGRIRVEARRLLARMTAGRELRAIIPGEQFSIFDEATRAAFLRCGALRQDPDLERHNNGVTFIVF